MAAGMIPNLEEALLTSLSSELWYMSITATCTSSSPHEVR